MTHVTCRLTAKNQDQLPQNPTLGNRVWANFTFFCIATTRDAISVIHLTHTHTHPFNGLFSGITQVSRYQKGKTNLDFTEARDSECQWHQLGHMQVCTSLLTDNHASTPRFL